MLSNLKLYNSFTYFKVENLSIEMKKHHSPLLKPANQYGSLTQVSKSKGIETELIPVKASFN